MKQHLVGLILPGDGDHRHGRNGFCNYGCKCDICRKAEADYQYNYMHQRPDQQRKKRDRQRMSRGHTREELTVLEMRYQAGENRGGKVR